MTPWPLPFNIHASLCNSPPLSVGDLLLTSRIWYRKWLVTALIRYIMWQKWCCSHNYVILYKLHVSIRLACMSNAHFEEAIYHELCSHREINSASNRGSLEADPAPVDPTEEILALTDALLQHCRGPSWATPGLLTFRNCNDTCVLLWAVTCVSGSTERKVASWQ